ncbi:MAG: LPS translocon maturation chaperone LptM [Saezia sp.]
MMKTIFKTHLQLLLKLSLGIVAVLTLSACGLKSDLYLPDQKAHHSQPAMKIIPLDTQSIS